MITYVKSVSIYEGTIIYVVLKLSTVDDKVLDGTAADDTEESPRLNTFFIIIHLQSAT